MSLITIENEQYRRDIIMLLEQDADYTLTDILLRRYLQSLGNPITAERLAQQLLWLKDQGLVALENIAGGLQSVRLTTQGEDVAKERVIAHGVARMPKD